MQRIYIDTINLDKPDNNGYSSIIVFVDSFSRWVELYPSTDYSAASAALALLQFVGRFGVPSEIHTDKATQYVNEFRRNTRSKTHSQYCTLIHMRRMRWLSA
jgi:hypothetical protein